ncbi:type II toxin-antitoxin system prevent-host-death family antitoxin [Singulisphaera sp. PoT]|uniref:type II toxin-antitoxin system prevent-host-death family antitoxin n=1 Tax=Singulisphaera sp. PoT TaxID=3411797 RepID=UPI003BF4AFB9
MEWQMSDAKNRFSEMLNRASSQGPQRVRRRDEVYVLMKEVGYERAVGKRHGFMEFLMQGPGLDELGLVRDQSPMRNIEL